MDTPPEAPAEPVGPFNLPVLKTIIEAQGLHGLRYGDYQRYRFVCMCMCVCVCVCACVRACVHVQTVAASAS